MSFQLFSFLTLSELEYFVNLMRIMTTINIHSFGVQVMKNTLVSCDSIKQEERKKHSIYSTGRKSWIFCFALLLPQILVNFQNQGQIWNLLNLTLSKHVSLTSNISAKTWSNCTCRGCFENVRTSRFQICPWFCKLTKICGSNGAKQNIQLFLPVLYNLKMAAITFP